MDYVEIRIRQAIADYFSSVGISSPKIQLGKSELDPAGIVAATVEQAWKNDKSAIQSTLEKIIAAERVTPEGMADIAPDYMSRCDQYLKAADKRDKVIATLVSKAGQNQSGCSRENIKEALRLHHPTANEFVSDMKTIIDFVVYTLHMQARLAGTPKAEQIVEQSVKAVYTCFEPWLAQHKEVLYGA